MSWQLCCSHRLKQLIDETFDQPLIINITTEKETQYHHTKKEERPRTLRRRQLAMCSLLDVVLKMLHPISAKMRSTLKQYGAVQGALYLLFLSTSAHLTRQLGMAPGGEFRRAYHEARNVPGCRIHLGDRPIHITLHRALAALSLWQKAKLVWHLLLNRSSIRYV